MNFMKQLCEKCYNHHDVKDQCASKCEKCWYYHPPKNECVSPYVYYAPWQDPEHPDYESERKKPFMETLTREFTDQELFIAMITRRWSVQKQIVNSVTEFFIPGVEGGKHSLRPYYYDEYPAKGATERDAITSALRLALRREFNSDILRKMKPSEEVYRRMERDSFSKRVLSAMAP